MPNVSMVSNCFELLLDSIDSTDPTLSQLASYCAACQAAEQCRHINRARNCDLTRPRSSPSA